jgi:segregation and condensation protein A
MKYEIKIESFEGPLDLLLHLISVHELDIYDIPITEVTNQYIAYLDQMKELDLEIASEFIVMAATLIEIKSKMLLPDNTFDQDLINFELDDPRAELVNKLVEYRLYRNASVYLKEQEDFRFESIIKDQENINQYKQDEEEKLEEIDVEVLKKAVAEVIRKIKTIDKERMIFFKSMKKDNYTVKDKVRHIAGLFTETVKSLNFKTLFCDDTSKEEVICTFLALLEMLKLKHVRIVQEDNFKDIIVYPKELPEDLAAIEY